MYAVYHGPEGLRAIVERAYAHARTLVELLKGAGVALVADLFFDMVVVWVFGYVDWIVYFVVVVGVNLCRIDVNIVGISFDETIMVEIVELVVGVFDVEFLCLFEIGDYGFFDWMVCMSGYLIYLIFNFVCLEM